MKNTTEKISTTNSLHTCGLKAFVEVQKQKKIKLMNEKTVVKK